VFFPFFSQHFFPLRQKQNVHRPGGGLVRKTLGVAHPGQTPGGVQQLVAQRVAQNLSLDRGAQRDLTLVLVPVTIALGVGEIPADYLQPDSCDGDGLWDLQIAALIFFMSRTTTPFPSPSMTRSNALPVTAFSLSSTRTLPVEWSDIIPLISTP